MKQFDFEVQSPVGIHARPAVLLVEKAKTYSSRIVIKKGDLKANAKNIISLLTLKAQQNESVTFVIDGDDEEQAAKELREFCIHNL
ncbi:HPr family phosphocarrier protein [Anaerostipes sp.]|uniref:HPr family phosphocarrier protein n=1 Tax=Anaerostipes sp. TaxID=1872530 RepID=UPI0025BDD26C|nr:HPr family phosphocarrier protein [Anaerostipes sp.]MBS7008644.1 HPr family phosphocarrier protein [Anaerostipes sp.]